VDDLRWCTLDGLKDNVIIFVVGQVELHDLEHLVLHSCFKWFLTKFTLKSLPEERLYFLSAIYKSFTVDPLFKTRDVNHSHRASTFARAYQLVRLPILSWSTLLFTAQANPANICLSHLFIVLTSQLR
jgi:hypothetical protein